MLEGLSLIDWDELGAPEIPDLLLQLTGDDETAIREAIGLLADKVAPLMLLSGYGQYTDLIKLMETELPHIVTPFLIEILQQTNNMSVKLGLLEILHNECNYVNAVATELGVLPDREVYEQWAHGLWNEVNKGLPIYQNLRLDSVPALAQAAEDLLQNLHRTQSPTTSDST